MFIINKGVDNVKIVKQQNLLTSQTPFRIIFGVITDWK